MAEIDYAALARRIQAAPPPEGEELGPLDPSGLGDLTAPPEKSWLASVGDVGEGFVMGAVDVLDRPSRFLRRLAAGHFGEAFKSLIPFSGSDWFTGGDMLEAWGVDKGADLGVLGSTRSVAGFGLEIATDPVSWFSGGLGKLFQRGTTKLATGGLRALEGAAGRAVAGGAKSIANRVGGALATAGGWKGAAAGAGIGAGLEALDPEGDILKGAVLGGLAGGPMAKMLRPAAAGLLEGAERFSMKTALRDVPDPEALQRLAIRTMGIREEIGIESALLEQKWRGKLSEESNAKVRDLFEGYAGREIFALQQGALDPATTKIAGGSETLAAFARRDPQKFAQAWDASSKLTPLEREAMQDYTLGAPMYRHLPGMIDIEDEFVSRGALERELVDDLYARYPGISYVPHMAQKDQNLAEMAAGLEGELRRRMPEHANDALPELIKTARGLSAVAGRGSAALHHTRDIAGSLSEILDRGGPVFQSRMENLGVAQAGKLAAVRSQDELLTTVRAHKNWVRSARAVEPGEVSLWGDVPLKDLPNNRLRRLFTETVQDPKTKKMVQRPVQMRHELIRELFGERGVLKTLFDPVARGKVYKAVAGFHRVWKAATTAFPGSVTRNGIGNFITNAVWHGPVTALRASLAARKAQVQLAEWIAGKTPKGDLRILGQKIPVEEVLPHLQRDGVVGTGIATSETGTQYLRGFSFGQQAKLTAKAAGSLFTNPAQFVKDSFTFDPAQQIWMRNMLGWNGVIEDNTRIAHYLVELAKAKTPQLTWQQARDQAMEAVRTRLFSPMLTPAERATRDILIPFYSWFRYNIPAQFQQIIQRPGSVVTLGRVKVHLDKENRARVPDEAFPDWIQGQFTIPVRKTQDGKAELFVLNSWLPLADLTEVDSPKKFIHFLGKQLSPVMSEIIEQGANFDLFFKRAIETYDGKSEKFLWWDLDKRSAHILRNIRLLNEFDRAYAPLLGLTPASERMADELESANMLSLAARTAANVKTRPFDLTKLRVERIKALKREANDLRGKYRRALISREAANAQQLGRLLNDKLAHLRLMAAWDPLETPQGRALQLRDDD